MTIRVYFLIKVHLKLEARKRPLSDATDPDFIWDAKRWGRPLFPPPDIPLGGFTCKGLIKSN